MTGIWLVALVTLGYGYSDQGYSDQGYSDQGDTILLITIQELPIDVIILYCITFLFA